MATNAPQRAYRAACPSCGAPVEFRSAASVSAVCSFCRSTLVRDGQALQRIGVSSELFDDHSPLQLGAAGKLQGDIPVITPETPNQDQVFADNVRVGAGGSGAEMGLEAARVALEEPDGPR